MATVLTTPETEPLGSANIPSSRLWRLSVDQYHEMLRTGILRDGDPVELIEGILVQKMGKNPPHVVALTLLRDLLLRLALHDWTLRIQDPIALDDSEPEPDIVLAQGTITDYSEQHPDPQRIGLVVEVADTSLADDRGFKKQLYARNRISQYWIINLVHEQVEVYTEPFGTPLNADYRSRTLYSSAEVIPLVLNGIEIASIPVAQLLP